MRENSVNLSIAVTLPLRDTLSVNENEISGYPWLHLESDDVPNSFNVELWAHWKASPFISQAALVEQFVLDSHTVT